MWVTPAWADFLVAIGHFNTTTSVATTTVEVNISPAFQPKCLIFFWTNRADTTNAVGSNDSGFGVGFAASTSDRRAVGVTSDDASAVNTRDSVRREPAEIVVIMGASSADGFMGLNSIDSDGFTAIVDNQFSASFTINYIALGGSDITNCATGDFQPGTGAGTFDVTTVGFKPDTVWLLDCCTGITESSSDSSVVGFSLGVAAGSPTPANFVTSTLTLGTTTNTKRYSLSGESWGAFDGAGVIEGRGSITAWLSNGFTFNKVEAVTAKRLYFLAIKGGKYAVGESLTQTDTTTSITTTGYGFLPKVVVVGSHNTTESTTDTPQDHLSMSLGAATSTTVSRVVSSWDEDNLATSESAAAIEFGASIAPVLLNISSADVIQGRMKINSVDANGVTFKMDDADPAQSFFWYWAAGGSSGGPLVDRTPVGDLSGTTGGGLVHE